MILPQWQALEQKAFRIFGHNAAEVRRQLVVVNWGDLKVPVHMLVAPYLERAYIFTQTAGYAVHRMEAFCWRLQRGSLVKLSWHSWAIAADINPDTNPMQHPGDKVKTDMNDLFINGFKQAGFDWGGDFNRPDAMHFQLRPEFWGVPLVPLGIGEKPQDAAGGPN